MQKRVLIVYTGGTFGMGGKAPSYHVPDLSPRALEKRLKERVPELNELARCRVHIEFNLDSAHVGPEQWLSLARAITKHRKACDGVVVLHGTDTLAYTASALSFLFKTKTYYFDKPVILTGAMRPLSSIRTDARRNLISSVEIAASAQTHGHRGVMVFFNDRLLKGNRARKKSATEFAAFESIGAQPLAHVGSEIIFERSQNKKSPKLGLAPGFSSKILMVHVAPSASWNSLSTDLDALVLCVYPSGTGPTRDPSFMTMLKKLKTSGVPVVLVSESQSSLNPELYEAGRDMFKQGVFWAGTMTPEAAFVKASLICSQKQMVHAANAEARHKFFGTHWNKSWADEG